MTSGQSVSEPGQEADRGGQLTEVKRCLLEEELLPVDGELADWAGGVETGLAGSRSFE